MTWNSENRMTESVSQNIYSGAKTLTRYKYDHEGNRVVKSSNYGEVVTPTPEISYRNDTIVTKHIFVSGVRVASKVCDEKSSNTYYQSIDHLGSTNLLTDAKGNFYEHIETFPDGTVWVKEYVDQSGVNAVFTSHEMDVETKFFYAKARYYDAQLGRFISVDPIIGSYLDGKPNGGVYSANNLNMYQYCYNNPVKLVDPDGKRPLTAKEINFITTIIGTGYKGNKADMSFITVDDEYKSYSAGRAWSPFWGSMDVYAPVFKNSTNKSIFIHEVFHQYQYIKYKNSVGFFSRLWVGLKLGFEQILYTFGYNVYAYAKEDFTWGYSDHGKKAFLNGKTNIKTLNDIAWNEGEAKFVEDFTSIYSDYKDYQKARATVLAKAYKKKAAKYAQVLKKTGITSEAISEVLGDKK